MWRRTGEVAGRFFGKGRAYGIEFLLEKTKGNFTGWASNTLSKSERQFEEINNGDWFSARQDRTHDISLVGTYQITPKLTISGTWVYSTGDAVTFPSGKYFVVGYKPTKSLFLKVICEQEE